MCGIVGYFSKNEIYSLDVAMSRIDPRGPDSRKIWEENQICFGHTRLSVIDLESGAQPMASDDGKVVLVFNGEIYNYRELRQNLTELGQCFHTSSDTEVLLKAYLQWGKMLIDRLDGIFAFSIFDKRSGEIFCARDRCGIKPFFYQCSEGYFGFASTLDAVADIRRDKFEIDYFALQDYLAFETVSSPRSIFTGIKQLEPAQAMTYDLDRGTLSIESYWQPPAVGFTGSFEEAIEQLDSIVSATVKQQMVSDVPIGAFLSGGIDSSLMTHYMAEHSSSQLQTFSVAFAQKAFDESHHAKEVARKYDTEHHTIEGPELEASLLEQSIASLDQPLADPAYPLTWYLSKVTKEHITVAISGDGGDELFGGYDKFNRLSSVKPRTFPKSVMKGLYDKGLFPGAMLGHFLTEDDWTLYKKVSCGQFPGNRKDFSRFVEDGKSKRVVHQPLAKWRDLVVEYGGHDNREALMKADLWTYLSDNCLVKTDRASMAWGLEVRVPLLGNEVVDFASKIPESIHFSGRQGKQLLRKLASRHLPESVWNRKKHGFSVPLNAFFKGQWRDLGDDLFENAADYFPILDAGHAQSLWRRSLAGKGGDRTTYALIVLLLWAKNNRSRISF